MKIIVVVALLFISKIVSGQLVINSISNWNLKNWFLNDEGTHTSILPTIRYQDVIQKSLYESKRTDTIYKNGDTLYVNELIRNPTEISFKQSNSINIASESFAHFDSTFSYRSSIGLNLQGSWNKWMNKTRFLSGWSARENDNQIHSFVLPLNNNSYYWYNDLRTRFGFNANKQLHISFGIDNQFFGEGYRSLIQSDQVAPNPFAMLRTKFWHFEYGLLYQFMNEQLPNSRFLKFSALHYFSYNITKKLNVTLFEQVLFPSKDGNLKRNFEVEYLNPIVFFRPQEYSIGSADNVLLALNTSYQFKNATIYGQLALDEFVLSEIRARSKWWANKYAVQLGFKGYKNKLFYRLEGNLVRPYTYAHIDFSQNAGILGRPMAHPLGSNFIELLAMSEYFFKKNSSLSLYTNFVLKGMDETGKSWGGDIYQNYAFRVKEYGNTIGQGLTQRTLNLGTVYKYNLRIDKKLLQSTFELYAQVNVNISWGELGDNILPAFTLGIRNNIFQTRKHF